MGLVDPTDDHYDRSVELLNILKTGVHGQIYTSIYVMAETGTLVAIRTHNNSKILKQIENLFHGTQQIALLLRSNDLEEKQFWKLFQKINRNSKQRTVSFVDCSNIELCRIHLIDKIISFDSHFDSWLTRIF